MQLDHVAVGEPVVAVHLLAVEASVAPPDARELEAGGQVLVDEGREVRHGRPLRQHEGPAGVDLVAGLLRVDADAAQLAEEG